MSTAPSILLPDLPSAEPLSEAVLFAFDDCAFPFREHVQVHLIPGEDPTLVLPPGPPGSHDEQVRYYGTVIRLGDTFHMWYMGGHGPTLTRTGYVRSEFTPCYATSTDGIHWEKPALGLVEFNDSKQNNIVDFPDLFRVAALAVLHDPEDSDPHRRFKMGYEASIEGEMRFCVAFSPDGLHWKASEHNPVGPFFELCGITKFHGLYYVNGQPELDVHHPTLARRLVTFASADFEHWSPCPALGLDRSPDVVGPSTDADRHCYEEVHLGAALWNRGNVILGIYGQWHGHPSGDRRLLTMDLGLALTHDAIHFHEPIPGYRFIPAREQPGSSLGVSPALMQGQGMENVGERTLYWYSLWTGPEGSGVRLVTWQRDRLGMLKPFRQSRRSSRGSVSEICAISCPIQILGGGKARLYANANGLGQYSQLRISLLDCGFRALPGYSGPDAAVIAEDGFRIPLRWGGGDVLLPSHGLVRLAVHFEGIRADDGCLNAIYVVTAE